MLLMIIKIVGGAIFAVYVLRCIVKEVRGWDNDEGHDLHPKLRDDYHKEEF